MFKVGDIVRYKDPSFFEDNVSGSNTYFNFAKHAKKENYTFKIDHIDNCIPYGIIVDVTEINCNRKMRLFGENLKYEKIKKIKLKDFLNV